MSGITKAQRDYARGRIQNIFAEKGKELVMNEKYYVPEKRLRNNEKWELIKDGKVSLAKETPVYFRLEEMYDFSDYCHEGYFTEEGKKKRQELRQQETEAMDALMLGDAEEALAIIKKYS